MKTSVLAVDDDHNYLAHYQEELEAFGFTVMLASTLRKAEELFIEHFDKLGAVILDGCVESEYLDIVPLIYTMRAHEFQGVMVAASRDPYYREDMMRFGCTHKAPSKLGAAELVAELLTAPAVG